VLARPTYCAALLTSRPSSRTCYPPKPATVLPARYPDQPALNWGPPTSGTPAGRPEVVTLAIRGHTNTEIAKALWLSPYTVQDHLKSAFDKGGVSNRSELTAKLYFDHPVPKDLSRAPR
ncbi:MAG: helix-turn-helix transcriptional regulator, partial [Actinomycetota bacterium]|nr:helix-turn-helix transcriptional regulator [Actinomycetota bacterium]